MSDPKLKEVEKTIRAIPFPTRFAVEVCADCNLHCSMCHHPEMVRPKGKMPLPLWKKCADEIARTAPDTNCWFSFCGEPLLEPDLLAEMLAYGKSVGLTSLNINTNGMLLTPDTVTMLLDSGVDLIVIGIDGFSKETYEKARQGGDRDVVYAQVEHLLTERTRKFGDKGGPEIQVQFIEMDFNSHEIEEFSEYWLARGAVLKVRNMLSWGGRFDTPVEVGKDERIPCPWAMTMMHVFWDGRVPRCPGDTEGDEGVGNAWDDSLSNLWMKLGKYRDIHMDRRFGDLPDRCQECRDWMTGIAQRVRPESRAAGEGAR